MYTMTTTDARMIRSADSICFDTSHGAGQIRAIVRGNDREHERTYTIPVEAVRLNDYGTDGATGDYSAFAMLMSAPYDDLARTIVRHIRKGSRIGFVWTRDNSSPVTKEAGVVIDMLDIKIQNGSVCDTFRVQTYIGLDNSARMVKRT